MDDSRSTVDYLTSDLNFSSKSSIRSTIEYLTTDLNFSSNSSISRKNCFLTFLQLMAYTLDDGRHTAIPGSLGNQRSRYVLLIQLWSQNLQLCLLLEKKLIGCDQC
ncbi:uncharacterized protein [Solanum lycopersicum]|uniref:uncharacterized protein isoform X2 n=1 Tax=Solanum lycopersicum TaxID=4081 RepID=UPI000532DE8A